MSATRFFMTYFIAMLPTYFWRWGFFAAAMQGSFLSLSTLANASLIVHGLMLASYLVMIYACKKRAEATGKNYLVVFPIIGGVFDILIPAWYIPSFCNLAAMILGTMDLKGATAASTVVNSNESSVAEKNEYEGIADLKNDSYKIYLVKKYKIEKSDALGKFICRSKLFDQIDGALGLAHQLEQEEVETKSLSARAHDERIAHAKSLGIVEREFGQGYLYRGQKFFDLSDAIVFAEKEVAKQNTSEAPIAPKIESSSREVPRELTKEPSPPETEGKNRVKTAHLGVTSNKARSKVEGKNYKKILLACLAVVIATVPILYFNSSKLTQGKPSGNYALFSIEHIGLQANALEKKLGVSPMRIDDRNGYSIRTFEGDRCYIRSHVSNNGTITSLETSCAKQFPTEFQISSPIDRYVVFCINCGNAADPRFFMRSNGSRASPVITDYEVDLKYESKAAWEKEIARDERVDTFEVEDKMINCTSKYDESAKRLWKYDRVVAVRLTGQQYEDDAECRVRKQRD